MIEREREVEPREGEEGATGAFRGPYYDFVGRIGPYPQGPTTKGIHTPPDAEAPASELAVDDQTVNEAPTTEQLLQVRPRTADDEPVEGEYEPMEPGLEPEPVEPGVPVIAEQPGFAYGDPGSGLENIHTEPPEEGEGGPEPGPEPSTLVFITPTEGSTVAIVHDVAGTGAVGGAEVELWNGGDEAAAITTASQGGAWGFSGRTPVSEPGPLTWTVKDGSNEASVSVTVEASGRQGSDDDDWQGLNRHADLDGYLERRTDLTEPEEWTGFTIAEKKAWLGRNAR